MNEVNLITPEEKLEQKASNVFKILDIIFISLVAFTIGFSYYSYKNYQSILKEQDSLNNNLTQLRADISNYQNEEALLRNLKNKYSTYTKTISDRIPYPEIIVEIYTRSQGLTLDIKDINFNPEKKEISIRVLSEADQFTNFVVNMKSNNFANSKYPTLFTPSDKNEEVNQAIKEYVVYVKYNPEVIKNAKN